MIKDQDLLYQMLSESRLDLMYLPASVVAWLFDRPEGQIDAASKIGIAAKDINPITQGSLLRADQNVLILKTDTGHSFRIYPDGGYSYDGQPTDLDGCVDALHDVPDHESCGCGCGGAGTCGEPAPQTSSVDPEGFENMAVIKAPDGNGIPQGDIMGALERMLMSKANDVDEGSYGAGTNAGPYVTYDELASSAAQDVETESMPTEDAGSSDMSGGPIGTDMFDVEDDIAQFLGMGTNPDVDGAEAEHEETMREPEE